MQRQQKNIKVSKFGQRARIRIFSLFERNLEVLTIVDGMIRSTFENS